MTRFKQVVDCTTGESVAVALTPTEEAARIAEEAANTQTQQQRDAAKQQTLNTIKQNITDVRTGLASARSTANAAGTFAAMKPPLIDFMDKQIAFNNAVVQALLYIRDELK